MSNQATTILGKRLDTNPKFHYPITYISTRPSPGGMCALVEIEIPRERLTDALNNTGDSAVDAIMYLIEKPLAHKGLEIVGIVKYENEQVFARSAYSDSYKIRVELVREEEDEWKDDWEKMTGESPEVPATEQPSITTTALPGWV